jgi:UDP-N-acetylglucosamine 4-epimerase
VFAPARAGDVRDSQADPAKAVRLIGFNPRTTLREGLERTLDWYRSQR